jgi:transposase
MKPYPIEFRRKIISVYEQENISIRKLAQRFQVAKSFIQKLLKQYQQTGDLNPQPQGGSPPSLVQEEQLITLIEIIESNNDATLEELCDLFQEARGIKVSRATMGRITLQLNYSVKKKLWEQQRKEANEFRKNELSFGNRYERFENNT